MQQFKRYFTGELDPVKDFGSKNAVSIQKCFRTSDIDEVGDESHLTFFEMLGNFSFGGYWKKEAIEYAHEFLTKEMGLEIQYVSVFKGDKDVPADEESEKIWKSLGLKVERHGREDNFWGPTGAEGPCGPTTEIYIGGVEVWNIVFNEYYSKGGKLTPLKTKGVDTGMGLERLAVVSQGVKNLYETDLFKLTCEKIEENTPGLDLKLKRIVADHIRAVVFLVSEGITPSNTDKGYSLRRIIRNMTHPQKSQVYVAETIINNYGNYYEELKNKKDFILKEIEQEENKCRKTFFKAFKQFDKGVDPFVLHTTYGLHFEIIKELARINGKKINEKDFEEKFKKHQEISRAGAEKKFGGHGLVLDTGELKAGNEEELAKVTKLHTATHLLNQALRETLGESVEQRGSDITPERARFDFTFSRKMTQDELKAVENMMNEKIKENLKVSMKEMPKGEAEKTGALHFFSARGGSALGGKGKYPDVVKVYFISPDGTLDYAWSKEFCGGPHVKSTGEIGSIKILKEEASSAGVRRIRIALV